MTFRKLIGKLHLWLGLASGLVVFIVAITGCLYVFEKEIRNWTESYRYIEPIPKLFLPPSQLKSIVQKKMHCENVKTVFYESNDRAATVWYKNKEHWHGVIINPYTGKIIKTKNIDSDFDFFNFVLNGHRRLWLPHKIGSIIVDCAVLIFIILLVSGLILWWPRNKNTTKQRVTIKCDTRWRRKNYDLHNVLGFYISCVIFFIALTGLVWGFEWVGNSIYWVSSGGKQKPEDTILLSDTTKIKEVIFTKNIDKAWQKVKEENPTSTLLVSYPEKIFDPIIIWSNPDQTTSYKQNKYFFDQYTLKELKHGEGVMQKKYQDADVADKINRMNYDIHIGAILGLPGKIIVFSASLIAASLPVTGFIIWIGRRKKKRI